MRVWSRFLQGTLVLLLLGCAANAPTASPIAATLAPAVVPTLAPVPTPTATAGTATLPSPAPTSPTPPPATPSPSPGDTPTAAPRPTLTFAPNPDRSGWVGPAPVSARSYYSVSLVVDEAGSAHAAAGLNGGIFYLTNRTGSWTRERLSTPPGSGSEAGRDDEPAIALDSDGSLRVVFTRFGAESTFGSFPDGIWLVSNAAGSWSAPSQLETDFFAHSPSLAVRDGRLHIAYVEGIPVDLVEEDATFPLLYMTDASGSWTSEQILPNGTEPRLQLGADGRARVFFANEIGLLPEDGLRYAVAGSSTGSFAVEIVPGTSSFDVPLDLALGTGDRPHIVWAPEEQPGARYAEHDGGSWTTPAEVMDEGTLNGLAIATDSTGASHVIVAARDGVWYATDASSSWVARSLTSARGFSADIAVDGDDRAHVLFMAGPAGSRQLWYGIAPAP